MVYGLRERSMRLAEIFEEGIEVQRGEASN